MPKKSEKNENKRESLKKVKDCLKKEPKETPKQKAKRARIAETSKQKANDSKVDLTLLKEAFRKQEREDVRRLQEALERSEKMYSKLKRVENERTVNTLLDIGYVFRPEEGKLLDYYLKKKNMGRHMEGLALSFL